MNESRKHTDQADSRETLESLEQKLRLAGYRSPVGIQLTPQEAGARAAAVIAKRHGEQSVDRTCGDCPCDGMGAVAAAVLIGVGVLIGSVITCICMGGLS